MTATFHGNGSHVPVLPVSLPGEFWGMAAYFNLSRSPLLSENLARFAASVRRQGLKLLIVELAFGDSAFEVPQQLCDILIRRRSDAVLWQKERLLNVGLEHLPPECDKVAWLDADILFENPAWVRDTAQRLESYAVVQPFEQVLWLPPAGSDHPSEPSQGLGEGQFMPGMADVMTRRADWRRTLADFFEHGHCGFAWAARREILRRHGLYDRHVLGGGDVTLSHAFYGDEDFWRGRNYWCRNYTKAELDAMAAWGRGIHGDIQGSVASAPGRLLHLWHGNMAGRAYQDRSRILKENDFDPASDVTVDDDGCLRWNSDKPDLHLRTRGYFDARGDASRV